MSYTGLNGFEFHLMDGIHFNPVPNSKYLTSAVEVKIFHFI